MSTRSERRERALRRLCRNCGKKGPHFVPPSFGDPGFYTCTSLSSYEKPEGECTIDITTLGCQQCDGDGWTNDNISPCYTCNPEGEHK